MTTRPLEIRELRDEDLPSLLDCLRAGFGERAHDEASWRWSSSPPGLPRRAFVGLREGRVVGLYAGRPTRTWLGGEERLCVQSVDLVVHPDERRGLGGGRLHRAIADAYFDHYGERGEDAVHFGWPVPASRRLGQGVLGYRLVRDELVLVRELGGAPPEDGPAVERLDSFGEDLRWLWDRCAPEWGAAALRDAAHARWRYLERPGVGYVPLGVRREGLLRGLAVVRTTPWSVEGALPLLDWLVPAEEPEVAGALLSAAERVAAEAGARRLVVLLPPWSAAFADLQERGWRAHPTPYAQLFRSFDRRFDADGWREWAWLTLADTDLA